MLPGRREVEVRRNDRPRPHEQTREQVLGASALMRRNQVAVRGSSRGGTGADGRLGGHHGKALRHPSRRPRRRTSRRSRRCARRGHFPRPAQQSSAEARDPQRPTPARAECADRRRADARDGDYHLGPRDRRHDEQHDPLVGNLLARANGRARRRKRRRPADDGVDRRGHRRRLLRRGCLRPDRRGRRALGARRRRCTRDQRARTTSRSCCPSARPRTCSANQGRSSM